MLVDGSVGNGCLIQKDFDDGMRVRFGFVPKSDGGFFSAMNRSWGHLEPGDVGIVKFLTENTKFAGDVEVIEEDDWRGGWAFFNNPALAVEFAERKTLTVIEPHGEIFTIDLQGTYRAVQMLKECQDKQSKVDQ